MFHKNQPTHITRPPKNYFEQREKQKRSIPAFLKIGVLVLIIFLALAYLLLFSSVFKVKNISLEGTPNQETLNYLNQFLGRNIFVINAKAIASEVQTANPQFKKVDVTLGLPSTLRIIFQERIPMAIWTTGEKNYLLDENAIAFKQTDVQSPDLINIVDKKNVLITPPVQIASANFINFLKNVKDKSKQFESLDMKVTRFEVGETTFQVDTITDKNIKILFDTTRSVSDQMDAAQKCYAEKKAEITKYMDVRVEGKVYYQ